MHAEAYAKSVFFSGVWSTTTLGYSSPSKHKHLINRQRWHTISRLTVFCQ